MKVPVRNHSYTFAIRWGSRPVRTDYITNLRTRALTQTCWAAPSQPHPLSTSQLAKFKTLNNAPSRECPWFYCTVGIVWCFWPWLIWDRYFDANDYSDLTIKCRVDGTIRISWNKWTLRSLHPLRHLIRIIREFETSVIMRRDHETSFNILSCPLCGFMENT